MLERHLVSGRRLSQARVGVCVGFAYKKLYIVSIGVDCFGIGFV